MGRRLIQEADWWTVKLPFRLLTWFKPTKTEMGDAGEQKTTRLSSLFLFLHSWQVWLQPQEPHEVVSLSPGCSTFAYGHR